MPDGLHFPAQRYCPRSVDGISPACVIASAGTVNTGAIDDLEAIADLCAEEGLWLHVDGCIGALLAIAPKSHALVRGIARADSIALDPHKWLHAPFEVGCALVRDAKAHHDTFAVTPEYLENAPRGIASGAWLHDYKLQTSRGFRALKVWMTLKEHGLAKFGPLIEQDLAHCLRAAINNHRTTRNDLDVLIDEVVRVGRRAAAEAAAVNVDWSPDAWQR